MNADDVTLNMFAGSGMEVGSGSEIDIDGTFTIAGSGIDKTEDELGALKLWQSGNARAQKSWNWRT